MVWDRQGASFEGGHGVCLVVHSFVSLHVLHLRGFFGFPGVKWVLTNE